MEPRSVDAIFARAVPPATRLEIASNRRFYDALWSASYVVSPERFNTWPLLSALAASATSRLEIGPGLHPRLPIAGTHFVDTSGPVLSRLKARAGLTTFGEITALPFSRSQLRPRSRWLLDLAVWGLAQRRVQAMRWYNTLFLPFGLLLQRRLACAPRLIDMAKVDELLLVCRRGDRRALVSGVSL